MKCLSLTQPMAWAIFHGKDIENRPWHSLFHGRIYIHASKRFDEEHYRWIGENDNRLVTNIPERHSPEFVQGAIIGEVTIVGCVRNHGSRWFFGPWGYVLENPELYPHPVPCKGKIAPHFFEVPPEVEAEIRQMKFESVPTEIDYDNDCAPD